MDSLSWLKPYLRAWLIHVLALCLIAWSLPADAAGECVNGQKVMWLGPQGERYTTDVQAARAKEQAGCAAAIADRTFLSCTVGSVTCDDGFCLVQTTTVQLGENNLPEPAKTSTSQTKVQPTTVPCGDDTSCEGKAGKPYGAAGQEASITTSSKTPPSTMCSGGCTYKFASSFSGSKNGQWTHTGDASWSVATGGSCSSSGDGGGDGPPQPRPDPIPAGKCPGTVNGVAVVVPCDRNVTSSDKAASSASSSASSPDGSTPNSSTETKETECSGGRCSTTTTTRTNKEDGTTETKSETKEQPKTDFCAENPKSMQCKEDEDSSIGGACSSVTCSGDAIQCAIAKEQAKRNCELFDANDASARGMSAAAAGDQPGDHPRNNVTEVAMGGGFDQTPLIAGSCPGDVTVPMPGGRSVAISFSQLCTPAAWLGNLLVGITALACLGIVFKGS